ncbi:MAG: DUF3368 domain-containing protein [Pyrinomonadaceae bacterium]
MSVDHAVINASPFILLSKCGLIELLPQLFAQVSMPQAVFDEILAGDDVAAMRAEDLVGKWLNIIFHPLEPEIVEWNLGSGESELLSFVLTDKINSIALIDDRAARRCANSFQIRSVGTAGLLVLAKQRQFISLVEPEIEKLISAGLFLSAEIRSIILAQADE